MLWQWKPHHKLYTLVFYIRTSLQSSPWGLVSGWRIISTPCLWWECTRSLWSTTSTKPITGNDHCSSRVLCGMSVLNVVGLVLICLHVELSVKANLSCSWSCSTATTSCLRSWRRNVERVDCPHTKPLAVYSPWASYQHSSLHSSGKCSYINWFCSG